MNRIQIPKETMGVLGEVLAERMKQVSKGYDAEHDDGYEFPDLAEAGAAMALQSADLFGHELYGHSYEGRVYGVWPKSWTYPVIRTSVRESLVIGAAFLMAEIERIDRALKRGEVVQCECGRLEMEDEAVSDSDGVDLCRECQRMLREESERQGLDRLMFVSSIVTDFLLERCSLLPGGEVHSSELYEDFSAWLKGKQEKGEHKGRFFTFGVFMNMLLAGGVITAEEGEGGLFFKGVSLKSARRDSGGDA